MMRKLLKAACCLTVLIGAMPAYAVDLSSLLPKFDWPSPRLPRIEGPAHPVPAPSPMGDESSGAGTAPSALPADAASPPRPEELDRTLQLVPSDQTPKPMPPRRPKGWRGLLPGSLK